MFIRPSRTKPGFRTGVSVGAWLAVLAILILFRLALTWLAVIAGLSAKTVDGASAFSYPLIFLRCRQLRFGVLRVDAWAGRLVRRASARDLHFGGERHPQLDPRGGHIPGAVNAPWEDSIGADHRLLPPAELRTRFESLGITEDTDVAVYCGAGISAVHLAVALVEAGYELPALYVGSWSEWALDRTRPVGSGI